MIALFLAPVYLLFCWYLWRRLRRWLDLCPWGRGVQTVAAVLFAVLNLSILPASFLEPSAFQRLLKQFNGFWLGVLLYTALVAVGAELFWALRRRYAKGHGRAPFSDRHRDRKSVV